MFYVFQNYVGDAWNVFDFIIVLGSYIDIIYTEVNVSIPHPLFFCIESTFYISYLHILTIANRFSILLEVFSNCICFSDKKKEKNRCNFSVWHHFRCSCALSFQLRYFFELLSPIRLYVALCLLKGNIL